MSFIPKTIDAVVVYTDSRQCLARSFRNECLSNTSKSFYRLGFFLLDFIVQATTFVRPLIFAVLRITIRRLNELRIREVGLGGIPRARLR